MSFLISLIKKRRDVTYLALSLLMIIIIFINWEFIHSPIIGGAASIIYFLVNGSLLGRAFFKEEEKLKLPLGILLLITLIGLVGWIFIITYRLRITETSIALLVVSVFTFLANKISAKPRKWFFHSR